MAPSTNHDPERTRSELEIYARRPVTPIILKSLYEFGLAQDDEVILTASKFLHTELPIRVAHLAEILMSLPGGLSDMPSIRKVLGWYTHSFQDLRDCPFPKTSEEVENFRQVIERIKLRHTRVVETVAQGIVELKERTGTGELEVSVQEFLDRFYTARIGIRVLIGQHVGLHERRPGSVGIISAHTSPAEITQQAAEHSTRLCQFNYGRAPRVEVLGCTKLEFVYIPSHVYHIMLELLKNSMRAVTELHPAKTMLPPIRVIIADGSEDIAVKISDEGGGIPRQGLNKIWTYLFTTGEKPDLGAYAPDIDAMAGYGYGLPLSRLYARYFGGELQVLSMEGYGTDAYLHLNKLGTGPEVTV